MPGQRTAVARPGDGPTMHRILLGGELRELRREAGVTVKEAAEAIRGSEPKVYRLENGLGPPKERDVRDLLDRYGVSDAGQRASLLARVRKANRLGWWYPYRDLLPPRTELYLGMEEAATLIRTYEDQHVPRLLQTEDYARAFMAHHYPGADPALIDRGLRVRMTRQQVLTHAHEGQLPRLWAVVDEAALRRPVPGPPEVTRAQLERLVQAAKEPHITLFVLPLTTGGPAADTGSFTILRFDAPGVPDVVHVAQLTASTLIDRREEVESYMRAMDRITMQSLRREDTIEFLHALLNEL
jgi:transcriptional regulator with XRE-family HTH domain